jgi:hypothetical protein
MFSSRQSTHRLRNDKFGLGNRDDSELSCQHSDLRRFSRNHLVGRAAARLAFAPPPRGNELLFSGGSVSRSFDLTYHYPLVSKRRRGTGQSC